VGIDQIINNAAKMRDELVSLTYLVFVVTASAGQLGATHSQALENWFCKYAVLKLLFHPLFMMLKGFESGYP
jgi:pyruvate dehydrogenase E1 component beta subunit